MRLKGEEMSKSRYKLLTLRRRLDKGYASVSLAFFDLTITKNI